MISICCPTRSRPQRFATAMASARRTAGAPVEVVAWVDEDDPAIEEYRALSWDGLTILYGPREIQSNLWNRCWARASGDLAMLAADDIMFRTPGWARLVERAFERWPDRIGLVYGDDGSRWKEATLPFVSREWIETAGIFTPPYFKSWFADRWIWEIAYLLDRKLFLPRLKIEHRHASYGKAPKDQTYLDAEQFRREQDPKALYLSPPMLEERAEQAMRLCRRIYAERDASVPSPV